MSEVIEKAVQALQDRLEGGLESGTAKFVIDGEGEVIVDSEGVRADTADADVTLNADAETFEAMLSGDLNPTAAFMSGKLTIDGDMGLAMQLAAKLA